MVLTTMNVTGKKYTTRVYSTYIAICLPKWTDDATPLTVLCGLACFQRCSPVRRSGILREITCVIRPLNSTVLNVQLKTSLFVHYQAQRIEHNRDIMTKRFINLQFSIYLLTCSINPEYTECGKITLVLPKSFTCSDSRSGNKVGLIYSFRSNAEADLGMFSMFGRTGAPTTMGPPQAIQNCWTLNFRAVLQCCSSFVQCIYRVRQKSNP